MDSPVAVPAARLSVRRIVRLPAHRVHRDVRLKGGIQYSAPLSHRPFEPSDVCRPLTKDISVLSCHLRKYVTRDEEDE